jgi:hypothetical protein
VCLLLSFFLYKKSKMSAEQPTMITLDNINSIQILAQYIEVAQQKGAYLLTEAEILKRAMDVLINNIPDKEIDTNMAKQFLIQGVVKGQKHGSYTLNDAALLNKVVMFVSNSLPQQPVQQGAPEVPVLQSKPEVQQSKPQVPAVEEDRDDLSDLAEPIPLKPKEV